MEAHRDYLLSCVEELPPFRQQHPGRAGSQPVRGHRLRRSTCRGSTTRRWTGTRCGPRTSPTAERGQPGQPAGGGGDRGRPAAPHRLVARHGDEDHDRRSGARGRRRDRAVREHRSRRRTTSRSPRRATWASTSAGSGRTSRPATGCIGAGDQLGAARHRRARRHRAGQGAGPAAARGSWSSPPAPSWSSPGLALTNEQQIFDSNSYLLAAAAKAAGAQVFRVGPGGRRRRAAQAGDLRPADPGRPDLDHRRGQPGRLRHRQGGDAGAGGVRLRPGRHAARQAAGLRADR